MQANRGVTLILLSLMTRLGSPKPVLTLQPNWPLFFTGETVTLTCSGRPFRHHGFFWYRNESNSWPQKHASQDNIYTIAPVTEDHSGVYRCSSEFDSDPVRLNVSALPKANLTVQPKWRPLYNGETVTLSCEVDSDGNWIYSWYKDQAQMAVSQTAGHSVTGNRLTIPRAAGSDQGQYWCEGRLEERKVTSQCSDSINLTVAALPKPTLDGRNVTSQPSDSITLSYPTTLIKQQGTPVILHIALGVGFCLIVLALIFILFQKHRRNKGLSQAAGPSCEPLRSRANVTNQKNKRKEAGGHEDVVCSVLGLQDQKSKNTPKAEGCDNVIYSIVALEDQKKKKRKEKNTQKARGCEDVVYSTVNQKRMKKNTDEAEGGNDVVYSTLALEDQKKKKEKNPEKAEGGNDVVYSTLALEDQKKEKKKKKKKKKEKNTANGDADVLYSTVRTGQREQHWLPDPPPL